MSYNGSGTFVINSSGQPVVAGTVITSTAFNALTADLGTGLSTAITKDGQTTPTANIPMGTYKITDLGVGTAATDAVRMSQIQSNSTTFLTAAGTDTITATASPTLTAYASGNLFTFVVANTNTTAVTLNVDSLGAKAITRDGTTALAAADLVATEVVVVVYDGTRFQVVNPNAFTNLRVSGTLGVTGATTLTGAATLSAALTYGGVTLSNAVTGTGNMVLATSPILTTPNIGTPSAGVISACTSTAMVVTNPTITNYVESVVAIGNSSTTQTISLTSGTVQTVTMTGNCTFTMPTATAGKSFILICTQDGTGSRTATFTSVKWPAGTAPTLTTTAAGIDIISFVANGTSWFGNAAQAFA